MKGLFSGRPRFVLGAVCAVGFAFACLSMPAVSSGLSLPKPVESEVGGPGAASNSKVPFTSSEIQTPKRFNVVGLSFDGPPKTDVQIRVRQADGDWSGWHNLTPAGHAPDPGQGEQSKQTVSEPAWAGDADAVQYRLSEGVGNLHIHMVNTTGTATAPERAKTAVIGALHTATTQAPSLFSDSTAQAASTPPRMVMRPGWDPHNSCAPRRSPGYGRVQVAMIHHTETLNDYSPADGRSAVLGICMYHRDTNGWDDIGYNFLVDKYGTTYEGRAGGIDRAVIGAHAQGFNSSSTGIANLGSYDKQPVSGQALDAMSSLIAWKFDTHGVPRSGTTTVTSDGGPDTRPQYRNPGSQAVLDRISGHRDVDTTDCPGDLLYGQLPQLRAMVAHK